MLFPCPEFVKKLIEYLERFFALIDHTHVDLAPADHDHDSEYAPLDHNHSAIVGEIRMWAGFSGLPAGWLACGGQEISRTTYADLFAVIGTQFGNGDGTTTFNIPDFRNTFPLGVSPDPPINALGATGGEMEHTLSVAEMPAHSHNLTYLFARGDGASWVLSPDDYSSPDGTFTDAVSFTGGGDPHNNMPPYLAVYFIIYAGE